MYLLELALQRKLTDVEISKLSYNEKWLNVNRPTKRKLEEAKNWMEVRVAALIGAAIYYLLCVTSVLTWFPFIMLCCLFFYEIDYYGLKKEYLLEEYRHKVDDYLKQLKELGRIENLTLS